MISKRPRETVSLGLRNVRVVRFAAVGVIGLATLGILTATGVVVSPAAVGGAMGVLVVLVLGRKKNEAAR